MNCSEDQSLVPVRILSQKVNIHAFFDALGQDLGRIAGQVRAAENIFVGLEGGSCRFTVNHAELIEKVNHLHTSMPSMSAWDI
jgi:hypothetical protein